MSTVVDSPLMNFSGCHDGILKQLTQLAALPALSASATDLSAVQASAKQLIKFYHDVILKHHQEEEQELFIAVSTALHPDPQDLNDAKAQITRLTQEHRQIEAAWRELEPDLKRLAKGKLAQLDSAKVANLVEVYSNHALFEEAVFLPLSARLLDKNGMAALGMSLHMRQHTAFTPAYI